MKLSLVAPVSLGESDQIRLREVNEVRVRLKMNNRREDFRDQVETGTRKSFVIILFATIAVTIFWHRSTVFNDAFTVVHHMSAQIKTVGSGTSTKIQQQATSYEQEVDEIAQADSPAK